ncbi:hypothetical protein BB559_002950 [Furculomyces boomerangus]|uniref:Uncharacterized protein n=1 Tax=Furculomyces boomerangus TaxID=61424 RepID=A0A2T9YQM8_9FUNG|nr:hypothetical protein BB559_002950 [Furculomyces boomerangus]
MFSRFTLTRSIAARSLRFPAASRAFSVASYLKSGDVEKTEIFQGTGATPGKFATDEEQATGLDRLEKLAGLEGKEFFDTTTLSLDVRGTPENPTIVPSGAPWRLVGCQGPPGEEHELLWIKVERDHKIDRCIECGNVYKLSD